MIDFQILRTPDTFFNGFKEASEGDSGTLDSSMDPDVDEFELSADSPSIILLCDFIFTFSLMDAIREPSKELGDLTGRGANVLSRPIRPFFEATSGVGLVGGR